MPESRSGLGEVSTIVLAAGEGTRMRSRTPKVLHRLAGRSLVEHAVRAAAGLGPVRTAVVVGHGRDAVSAHLAEVDKGIDTTITVAVQEEQHGTGHAVRCALDVLPTDGLLLSGTYLVDRDHVVEMVDHVRATAREHPDLGILCTGPWPPYSFTGGEPTDAPG